MRTPSSLALASLLALLPFPLCASFCHAPGHATAQRGPAVLGFATPTLLSPTRLQRSATPRTRDSATPVSMAAVRPRAKAQSKSSFKPKRRHLGPTSEEIMASRSKDAERRLVEMRSTMMDRAEAVDEAPARWIDTTADSANGRHLGPTLEEISELRASRALERPAPEKLTPEAVSEATDAPRVREDRPSEEQLRALANLGVTETPQSKEHAMFLIREAREMQLAEGLGFATTNRRMGRLVPVDGAPGADTQAEAEQVIANYTQSEEDSHLNLALRGINGICRRPQ